MGTISLRVTVLVIHFGKIIFYGYLGKYGNGAMPIKKESNISVELSGSYYFTLMHTQKWKDLKRTKSYEFTAKA